MAFQSSASCSEGRIVSELLLERLRESPAGKAKGKGILGAEIAYTKSTWVWKSTVRGCVRCVYSGIEEAFKVAVPSAVKGGKGQDYKEL